MRFTMNKTILTFCTLGISLMLSTGYAQGDFDFSKPGYKAPLNKRTKEIIKNHRENTQRHEGMKIRMREAVKASSKDVTFKGKVVDLKGKPIDDAVVVVSVRSFDPDSEYFFSSTKHEISTDKNGGFVLSENSMSLSVRDIIKKGYEFNFEYVDYYHFEFSNRLKSGHAVQNSQFDPNSNESVVFRVRKRGTVDFLVKRSFSWPFRMSKNEPFKPLLLGEWEDPYGKEMNLFAYRSEKNKPLELSCEFNEDYSKFKLLFRGVIKDSGVYLSDTLLYKAPLDGYQESVIYQDDMLGDIENGKKRRIYNRSLFLYVKGPGDSYYSRIDLTICTDPFSEFCNDGSVRITGSVYTNPEGRRYLEYDKKFNSNERVLRSKIRSERSQARMKARKNKKQFNEKAFIEKIKVKYKNRNYGKL